MMNPDSQVLYSNVPQDEWNKPKFSRVLSHGPKSPKAANASRSNRGLATFIILTLVAMTISIVVVVGLRYFDLPEILNGRTNSPSKEKLEANITSQEKDIHNILPENDQPVENNGGSSAESLNPVNSENDTKIDEKLSSYPGTGSPQVQVEDSPIINETAVNNPDQSASEDSWVDVPADYEDIVKYEEFFESPTTEREEVEYVEQEKGEEHPTYDERPNDDVQESPSDVESYKDEILPGNDSFNDSHLYISDKNTSSNGEEDGEEPRNSSEIVNVISDLTKKYFNSSSFNGEDFKQWIETLASQPSLEVVLIASAIIFVGLSLLIIAIACLLTRSRGAKRRREIIDKVVEELESNEKVVLLSDEPSEDEYVKA